MENTIFFNLSVRKKKIRIFFLNYMVLYFLERIRELKKTIHLMDVFIVVANP